jgi:hypothetical protein
VRAEPSAFFSVSIHDALLYAGIRNTLAILFVDARRDPRHKPAY